MEIESLIWPLIAATLIALYLALLKPAWSGVRGKTAWDWIGLLLVPSMVGFGTFLISASQAKVEEGRLQESALQQYFDRISGLVLSEGDLSREKTAVGRAHTMAILSLVSGDRAGRVLVFLREMGVIEIFVDDLEGLNFEGAELKGFDLSGLDFEGANFAKADLEHSNLSNADFEGADLRNADLDDVDFRHASFEGTLLKGADLFGTDLRGADLSHAVGLSKKAVSNACYDETTRFPAGIETVRGSSPGCFNEGESDD